MRFYENYSTYFVHEGGQLVGDYYNGNIVARYVPGAAGDEPVAQIDKFGARTGFHSDERGSIIAGSNSTGANSRIVTYDEYGKRGPGGSYRFAYTGQVHLLNDIYDYKARNYNARLGPFVQTDRIGYGDGMNMYAYVGGDPVNFTDPTGTETENTWASSKATPIDNDDEWQPFKGPSNADLGGGHSYDGMGMLDNVRIAGGRHETAAFERDQASLFNSSGGRWANHETKKTVGEVLQDAVEWINGLFTGTAHAPAPIPSINSTAAIRATLDRIEMGTSYPHRNDGSVFQNREGQLPDRTGVSYREYVVPTPGLSHAGTQRLVIGSNAAIYYTPDHYKTFFVVRRK